MRRAVTCTSAAVLLAVATAAPAGAHAGLMPGEVAPGTTASSELVIVHGCGPGGTIPTGDDPGSPTSGVTVTVPDGLELAPRADAAWTVTSTSDGGQLRFAATDPAGAVGVVRLPVDVTAADGQAEGDVWVPIVQDCTDGEQLAWTSAGPEEAGGPLPALRITVDAQAGMTAAERQDADRLPTGVVVTAIIAGAVVAGGAASGLSGRRPDDRAAR